MLAEHEEKDKNFVFFSSTRQIRLRRTLPPSSKHYTRKSINHKLGIMYISSYVYCKDGRMFFNCFFPSLSSVSQASPVDLTQTIEKKSKKESSKALSFSVENILDPNKFTGKHQLMTNNNNNNQANNNFKSHLHHLDEFIQSTDDDPSDLISGNYLQN
jgi:hypothetical protein